jgi:hypothetical protein
MSILHFATHIYHASLNYYVGIVAPTYSVDYGYNVGIALCPHI